GLDAAAAVRRARWLLGLVLSGLLGAACGMDRTGDCIPPPCALPLAVTVDVTASSGRAVADVLVRVSGATNGTIPCPADGSASTCRIPGTSGTYELEISAPGYETVRRSLTVSGTTPDCGCPTIVPQHLDVVLTPLA